jgi:hypothetical protein
MPEPVLEPVEVAPDPTAGDTVTMVTMGIVDEQPVAQPDPPAPPTWDDYVS